MLALGIVNSGVIQHVNMNIGLQFVEQSGVLSLWRLEFCEGLQSLTR